MKNNKLLKLVKLKKTWMNYFLFFIIILLCFCIGVNFNEGKFIVSLWQSILGLCLFYETTKAYHAEFDLKVPNTKQFFLYEVNGKKVICESHEEVELYSELENTNAIFLETVVKFE